MAGLSFGNQMGMPGSRYTQLLQAMPDTNNGTVAGGLASVLQGLLRGQLFNRDQQDQRAAERALVGGLQTWKAPDNIMSAPPDVLQQGTGPMPERPDYGGTVVVPQGKDAPGTGGFAGAQAALQNLGPGNEYAGRLASQLMLSKAGADMERQAKLDYLRAEQAYKPPTTRTYKKDGQEITQEFNSADQTWKDLGSSPAFAPKEPPADIAGYNFAKSPEGGGFKGTFEEWKRVAQQGAQETFGNTPIWGTDEAGNPVLMQPSNRGGLKQIQLPPGVTPQRGQTSKVDLGTQWAILDANGAVIGYQPKDIAGTNREQAIGTAQGEQAASAPGLVAKGEEMLATLKDVMDDPRLPDSVGWKSYLQAVPGSPQMGFGEKFNQLRGQAFLQAFASLRGGGAITEKEGTAATQAIGRLNAAQDEKDVRKALQDLYVVIDSGVKRQRAMMPKAEPAPGTMAPPPVPGTSAAKTTPILSADEQAELDALRKRFGR